MNMVGPHPNNWRKDSKHMMPKKTSFWTPMKVDQIPSWPSWVIVIITMFIIRREAERIWMCRRCNQRGMHVRAKASFGAPFGDNAGTRAVLVSSSDPVLHFQCVQFGAAPILSGMRPVCGGAASISEVGFWATSWISPGFSRCFARQAPPISRAPAPKTPNRLIFVPQNR